MRIIEIEKEKIHCGNLLLVNSQYPIENTDVRGMSVVDARFPHIRMKRDAANVLRLAFDKIGAGDIVPVSGYRPWEEQANIYHTSLVDKGEEFTGKYVAMPGHSEHHTGLAIDLGLNTKDMDFICPDFPDEGICHSFAKAAPEYGFIRRYAKDKEEITGISYEPWHFRYVGYPHSKIMQERNLSFEEYIEFIKGYSQEKAFIFRQKQRAEVEIYYISAKENKTSIKIPEKYVYQISGNNVDGFIVTLWRKRND